MKWPLRQGGDTPSGQGTRPSALIRHEARGHRVVKSTSVAAASWPDCVSEQDSNTPLQQLEGSKLKALADAAQVRVQTLICSMSRLSSCNGSAGIPAITGGLPDAACSPSAGSVESTLAGRDALPPAGNT